MIRPIAVAMKSRLGKLCQRCQQCQTHSVHDEMTADVKNAYVRGDQKLEHFLHNRLLCEEPDIFSNIETMKLKTFKSMAK